MTDEQEEDSGVFEVDWVTRQLRNPVIEAEYKRMLAYMEKHWEDDPQLDELDEKRLDRIGQRLLDKYRRETET